MDIKVGAMNGGAPPGGAGTPHCNSTAMDAISERLAEVTALAEQVDRALAAAARLQPAVATSESTKSATSPEPEIKVDSVEGDIHTNAAVLSAPSANTSGGASRTDWCCNLSPPARSSSACIGSCADSTAGGTADSDSSNRTLTAVQETIPSRLTLKETTGSTSYRSHFDDRSSPDDFVTASECTCTPPSRSSSFNTVSEGGVTSPWREHSEDGEDAHGAGAQAISPHWATVTSHQDLVRVPLVPSPILVPPAYLSDSGETGDEVLTGILERRSVTETRHLQVRRGGAETRAVSDASITETKLTSLRPSQPPIPPPPLPLRADEAFFPDDLPLPSPPFADESKTSNPVALLKEVSETPLPPPPPPQTATARFYCNPHLARHAIKGIF